jgi:hypothetical protein
MKNIFYRENRKQLLIIVFSFAILNSVLRYFIFNKNNFIEVLLNLCIYNQVGIFIVSLIIALIPFNKQEFDKRWLSTSFAFMLITQSLYLFWLK